MIFIDDKPVTTDALPASYPEESIERAVFNSLSTSVNDYTYPSMDALRFELVLRAEIVATARQLHKSGMAFKVFRKSKANPDYWIRRENGGFELKNGVKASDAVRDIYDNGGKYGTECATAMQIVYLGALLSIFPEDVFDRMFKNLYLMNWHNVHRYLRQTSTMSKQPDYLPGDRRYFANPDVDPETPEWQGENTIDLSGGLYYGHGMGIHTADKIIRELNRNRKKDADREAYLVEAAGRPDFKRLFALYEDAQRRAPVIRLTV